MTSIVDHVSDFLQSVVDGAPSVAEAREGIEEAVASVMPHQTRLVKVSELLGDETFVGDMGGLSHTTEADSGPSSSMPGFYAANTEHGVLYLDMDGEVLVLDD